MPTSENKAYLKILKARPNYICYTSCLGAVIAMTEMLKAAAHENIRIGKGKKYRFNCFVRATTHDPNP